MREKNISPRKHSGKRSRAKGLSFERQIANDLKPLFPKARRQLEYHEDDAKGVDLQGTGEYRFQCKKLRKYAPITCIEEVKCDRALGEVPVLVTAGDRKETIACLYWSDFMELIKP